MTVDDRGEGGLAYLVRPDDVISGQPLIADFREGGRLKKEIVINYIRVRLISVKV